jgi:Undecaprenyl-phosphate galactose phosphotransferase WbaP
MSTAAQTAVHVTRRPSLTSWVPWMVLLADVIALESGFIFSVFLRQVAGPLLPANVIGVAQYVQIAVAILLVPLVHYQLGLYPGYLLNPVEKLRRRTLATLSVFAALVAWDLIVARGLVSRGVLLFSLVFALTLPPIAESLVRRFLIRTNRWGMPVLMIGGGENARALASILVTDPDLGLKPVAFLDNHPAFWNTSIEGRPVAGPLDLARDFEARAEAAIVVLGDLKKDEAAGLLHVLRYPRVIVVPDTAGVASLWMTARDLGGALGLEIKKNLLIRRNHVLKRAMDQMIGVPLFVLSLPVMAMAALWIKLVSRGPALHAQMREGFDGQRVKVWKLRTMHMDGDRLLEDWLTEHPEDRARWQRHFKLERDPRVIPGIGRLLRRTSLDELPQLWAVLKGEMSLVGPRPFPDYHLEHFSPDFRTLRNQVLPGLTGLWQVNARSNGDVTVQESMDTYYIRNWSPWLDLYILARTVVAVLSGRGAY